MDTLESLNARFAIPFKLRFKPIGDAADLIVADISNTHAKASLCLQGGHILSWQPVTTAEPVLWLSPAAKFAPDMPIRGGIPVCWPWFGAHVSAAEITRTDFPMHGFARTQPWQVTGTRSLDDGSTEIALSLFPVANTQALWPAGMQTSRLDMLVNVGQTLKIALITRNLGATPFTITEALHTYFYVGDLARTTVTGLEGVHFHDKAAGWTQGDQVGTIGFTTEVDRVYVNAPMPCSIVDPVLQRSIQIQKLGSQSTVVWNPGAARAAQMGDVGGEEVGGWRNFVCVESGNALENAVTVSAGGSHTLAVEYRVTPLQA